MKFRKKIAGFYGAALAAGLTLLAGPQLLPATGRAPAPTITPTPTPAPTRPVSTIALTKPTATPLPTVSPTPIPLYRDEVFEVTKKTVYTIVEQYLTAYYSNDMTKLAGLVTDVTLLNEARIKSDSEGFSSISDLSLFYKEGTKNIDQVVYASYTVHYNDSRSALPQFSEIVLEKNENKQYRVITQDPDPETEEALVASRQTLSVLELSIPSLIHRYHNACLDGNEELLKKTVVNYSFLNSEYLESRYHYTESFGDYKVHLFRGINEIDYIAIVTYSEKLVLIDTPAPCIESYYIHLNQYTGQPFIYLGIISAETEAFAEEVFQTPLVQELADKTNQAMQEALMKDEDLKIFYQHLADSLPEE